LISGMKIVNPIRLAGVRMVASRQLIVPFFGEVRVGFLAERWWSCVLFPWVFLFDDDYY